MLDSSTGVIRSLTADSPFTPHRVPTVRRPAQAILFAEWPRARTWGIRDQPGSRSKTRRQATDKPVMEVGDPRIRGTIRVRASETTGQSTDLRRFHHLLASLTWRDLRVRYKQSILGIAWAVVLPLSMMLVFTFVFTRAVNVSDALGIAMPYALFAYTGLVPWTFFSSSLNGCVQSLVANRNLVTKVYFPREVFPLSCVAVAFVDFCIAMTVLVALMAYFHFRGGWSLAVHSHWAFVPVIVAVQVALTVGLGMMLAMGNLFYRDVRQVVGVVLQLWMFVSAVVVPAPRGDGYLARVIAMNPLIPIITAYRDCILQGQWPDPAGFLYSSAFATVALGVGWIGFRRASYRFAECI